MKTNKDLTFIIENKTVFIPKGTELDYHWNTNPIYILPYEFKQKSIGINRNDVDYKYIEEDIDEQIQETS